MEGLPPQARERLLRVLDLLAQGNGAKQIAGDLALDKKVVQDAFGDIRRCLGARTLPHAVAIAFHNGVLDGRASEGRVVSLSPRLTDVLALVAQGWLAKQIAGDLRLTTWTVQDYFRQIRHRLGAHTLSHAVAIAFQNGLLSGATARPIPDSALRMNPESDTLPRTAGGGGGRNFGAGEGWFSPAPPSPPLLPCPLAAPPSIWSGPIPASNPLTCLVFFRHPMGPAPRSRGSE